MAATGQMLAATVYSLSRSWLSQLALIFPDEYQLVIRLDSSFVKFSTYLGQFLKKKSSYLKQFLSSTLFYCEIHNLTFLSYAGMLIHQL